MGGKAGRCRNTGQDQEAEREAQITKVDQETKTERSWKGRRIKMGPMETVS